MFLWQIFFKAKNFNLVRSSQISLMSNNGRQLNFYISFCIQSVVTHSFVCMSAQSCLTLCNPMDCSPPGSSVHRNFPDKNTEVGCYFLLQGIFPTHTHVSCIGRRILYHCSHQVIPHALLVNVYKEHLSITRYVVEKFCIFFAIITLDKW